jgi:hypothetical protein
MFICFTIVNARISFSLFSIIPISCVYDLFFNCHMELAINNHGLCINFRLWLVSGKSARGSIKSYTFLTNVSVTPRYRTIASCGLYFKVIICLFAKDTVFKVQSFSFMHSSIHAL